MVSGGVPEPLALEITKAGRAARLLRTIGIVRARAKIRLQNFVYNVRRLVTFERMAAV
ncbi:MAG: hypothetical protein WB820_15670 [Rhodoplanes sp.]